MVLTAEQKTQVETIIKDQILEFVPCHEVTYLTDMIEDSTKTVPEILVETNRYLNSISVPMETLMVNAIYQNAITIMNTKLTTYLASIGIN